MGKLALSLWVTFRVTQFVLFIRNIWQ